MPNSKKKSDPQLKKNILLIFLSFLFGFFLLVLVFELGLVKPSDHTLLDRAAPGIPAALARRPAYQNGHVVGFCWHDKLHLVNAGGNRLLGDFPPKKKDHFRIICIGDSLTYGLGVAEQEAYPRQLERLLRGRYPMEVLNLGVLNYSSADIVRQSKKLLPVLQPDLAIYGVCLNDNQPGTMFVLSPKRLKITFYLSLVCAKLINFYSSTGLGYRFNAINFSRNVSTLNKLVKAQTGRPAVALVLYPSGISPGELSVGDAERFLRRAGVEVIPSTYIKTAQCYPEQRVSQWDRHPNAALHTLYARQIADYLIAHALLR